MGGSAARLRQVITEDAELACRYRAVAGRNIAATPTATAKTTPTPITVAPESLPKFTDVATTARSAKAASSDDEAVLVDAAKLIAAYVGSLVSGRTAFDQFRDALLRGDPAAAAAYPLAAQRGLKLFVGRAGCGNCHVGPMFSNGEFADIGRPFFICPGVVDPGRQGGIVALRASRYNLLSRWAEDQRDRASAAGTPGSADVSGDTQDAALKTRHLAALHRNFGEFKVPSLRNVALTAPYLHDGSLATLDDVLSHYSDLDLERLHADGEQLLKPQHFSGLERADLLAFLHSLSDPGARVEPDVPDPPCEHVRPPG
jgi:cytochrome c peroxidase